MNYMDLSVEKLKKISIDAAKKICAKQSVDLIIYVAKAGLPIAVYMNEVFNVKLLGIGAQRKGNSVKAKIAPLISLLPRFVRDLLITLELKSKIHKKDSKRNVSFHDSVKEINPSDYKNILIVDDSVDTGNSMKLVYEKVKEFFPDANIKTYSLNVWDESKSVFMTDYCSYENTVIRAPMSKDSKEYDAFCRFYNIESKDGYV